MLILSPRAVERLESYTPPWPLPKIFRMTKGGKLIEGIFEGETINTPSMLCVEDYIDALEWAKGLGGLDALIARADANAEAILDWVARTPWIANLAETPATASNTSVCLVIADPDVLAKGEGAARRSPRASPRRSRRKASPSTSAPTATPRRACASGAARRSSAPTSQALTPWLDWAFAQEKAKLAKAA